MRHLLTEILAAKDFAQSEGKADREQTRWRWEVNGYRSHEVAKTQQQQSYRGAEKPRALRKMAELQYGSNINYSKFADTMCLPVTFVRRLFESHAEKPNSDGKNRARVVSIKRTTNLPRVAEKLPVRSGDPA